jgi:uncharacterized protein
MNSNFKIIFWSLFPILAMQLISRAADPAGQTEVSHIKSYRELGTTGLKVSDIGFGAGYVSDPAVIQYALDMGINYFDTAESYNNGKSEETIGKVAAKNRDKMIICTKLVMDGKTKKDDVISRVDQCLKRLQTSYCDILMIHGGNPDAVNNKEIFDAFDILKKDGKIRFTGVSNHGPYLGKELLPVIESRKVDVILLNYDPKSFPELPELMKKAHEKGIGLVAMKVLGSAGKADLEEFKSKKFPFHVAALRWALRNPEINTVIPSISLMDQVDEYIKASGMTGN